MKSFHLTIIACNKILCDAQATYCGVMTDDGSLGLESSHEPILSVLKKNSRISFRDLSGSEREIQIGTGMFSFKKNECTIVVSIGE